MDWRNPYLIPKPGQGPGTQTPWVVWSFPVVSQGGVRSQQPPGMKTIPPGGTLSLVSFGDQPLAGLKSLAHVSAPYGVQGALVDLGIRWVHRGQSIYLPYGGQVAPELVMATTKSCTVVIDWHPGPPETWEVPLVLGDTAVDLPPWSFELVWSPEDGPATTIEGAAAFPIGLGQTPGQIVPLSFAAVSVRTPASSGVCYARCKR